MPVSADRLKLFGIQPYALADASTRKDTAAIVCDGVTTYRATGIWSPGARGGFAGVANGQFKTGRFLVPTANPAANAILFALSSTPTSETVAWSLYSRINTLGGLDILQNGAAVGTDLRQFRYAGFRAAYSGKVIVDLIIQLATGTSNPVVLILVDGASGYTDISASFVLTSGGSPVPDWLSPSLVSTYVVTGLNWPASSQAPVGHWSLGWWSATEMAEYARSGRVPFWDRSGGSTVNIISDTARNSDFSAGATDWASIGATLDLSGGYMRITTAGSNQGAGLSVPYAGSASPVVGCAYRWEFDVIELSGGNVGNWNLLLGGSNEIVRSGMPLVVGQRYYVDHVITLSGGGQPLRIVNTGGAGNVLGIDNVKLLKIGAITLPVAQSIPVLGDGTLIGGNPGRMLGCQVNGDVSPVSQIRLAAASYTTASVQLLGGVTIPAGIAQRIVSVSGNSSAAVNLSLGIATGGTSLIATQAVNGNFDISTFASRIVPASEDLWLTFSGATTASITITLSPL